MTFRAGAQKESINKIKSPRAGACGEAPGGRAGALLTSLGHLGRPSQAHTEGRRALIEFVPLGVPTLTLVTSYTRVRMTNAPKEEIRTMSLQSCRDSWVVRIHGTPNSSCNLKLCGLMIMLGSDAANRPSAFLLLTLALDASGCIRT